MRQKVSVTAYLTFSLAKTKHALGIRMPPFSFGDSDMTDQRKGSDAEPTTHFGFKNVPESQKAEKVAEVFHSVAAKYDLMNDVLSGGMHRLWKRFTIELSGVRTGNRVLDIAGGTGDLAAKFSKLVGPTGQVVLADINGSMLKVGRDRLLDKGVAGNIEFVQADAEKLPFPDNHFDCVTIAFGLGFAALKIFEWVLEFRKGIGITTNEYFSFYFFLTGMHFLHLLIGFIFLGIVVAQLRRGPQRSQQLVETGATYWHMVDFLWINIFALLYVVR